MIFYLTFNDSPSGIYSSQVIDVVKFLRSEFKANIKLVAFISLRKFSHNRAEIKKELPDAIIIPMVPGVKNWKRNLISLKLLYRFKKPDLIIGRSVLATQLALMLRESGKKMKIVYDGRGAIEAEWKEYKVIEDADMIAEIHDLEKKAILSSDFRIAVSEQLAKLWKKDYGYERTDHVVIPCTLNKVFENFKLDPLLISDKRKSLGFYDKDLVFVYSGSLAGWQSFELLYNFIRPVLEKNLNAKLFFLAERSEKIKKMEIEFPGRIICKKVKPEEVPEYLNIGDYGLLLREKTVTNRVASPVKFAEYLSCGLPVVISDELGDYAEFVVKNKCGFSSEQFLNLEAGPEKELIKEMALKYFSKHSYRNQYKQILELI